MNLKDMKIGESKVFSSVIEGPLYKKELEVLIKDPIIIQLAQDVKNSGHVQDFIKGLSGTMNAALKEYQRRGGKNAKSIGGPLKAIQTLLLK